MKMVISRVQYMDMAVAVLLVRVAEATRGQAAEKRPTDSVAQIVKQIVSRK